MPKPRPLLLALALLALPAAESRAGALSGPVLDDGVVAVVQDVVQLPATSGVPPLARVNVLREAPDGSGRLFVNDLRGPLYVLDGGTLHTYLDLAAEIPAFIDAPGLATGFVSFALHPGFASNGLLYTVHTEAVGATPPNLGPALPAAATQHSVLTEWTASDPSADVFAGTRRELIRVAATHFFHNLGEIAFRPDAVPGDEDHGLLYLGNGEYGSVFLGSPEQLQRLDTPYGALLRIDPTGGPFVRDGTTYGYGIPAGNPFADDGDPDTLGEIYALGFRNAHRIAWDQGEAFVSDVGQGNLEEIDRLVPGGNYGWPVREGSRALDPLADPETTLPLPPDDALAGFRYPVAQYDHEEGLAIAGGFVYRGSRDSALYGQLVFGDIANGRVFYADVAALLAADDGDPATTAPLRELHLEHEGEPATLLEIVGEALGGGPHYRADLRFAQDASGDLYVTTKQDGFVRRLVPLPRCDDGADNDGDGAIDHPADPGCAEATSGREDPACSDGVDNDLDGRVDWDGGGVGEPDPQCGGLPSRAREHSGQHCALGVAVLTLLWPLRRIARAERRVA